jgi:hypothetical protein
LICSRSALAGAPKHIISPGPESAVGDPEENRGKYQFVTVTYTPINVASVYFNINFAIKLRNKKKSKIRKKREIEDKNRIYDKTYKGGK